MDAEASDGNPYHQDAYAAWHALLTDLITGARRSELADFLAHALLSASRTDRWSGMVPGRRHAGDAAGELARSVLQVESARVRGEVGSADMLRTLIVMSRKGRT